jgi:hypothetical protein
VTEPASLTAPAPAPALSVEPIVEPPTLSQQSTPAADIGVTAGATDESAAPPTEVPAIGALLLPPAADRHRVFVDGQVVKVKGSRAIVPCGAREVRIGSRGAAQNLDVVCGGETEVPAAR